MVQFQDFVDMTDCRAPLCVSNTRLSQKAIRCKGTPGRGEDTWEFPKTRVPFWGVPIIRTILYWGLCWGTLILGNYHIDI